jgi:hypothetical protein
MARLVMAGMVVTLVGMGIWVFSTPGHLSTWSIGSGGELLYVAGQVLMLIGAIVSLFAPLLNRSESGAALEAPATRASAA